MDRGSGRSNRGRGRFGRSHGSSEFRTEKGLIDSLPYLRYRYGSSVVSPHKVQEFLQAIKNYTLQHYSKGLHKIFELGGGSYEEPEEPEEPEADASPFEIEKWKTEYKNYNHDSRKFEEDKIKLVGTILGQLSRESVDTIRQTEDGRKAIDQMLPLTLIKTIVSTHMILGKIDNEQNLYEARRLYEGIKQGERETLDNYCRRFEAAVASLTEAAARAGMDTETPGEKLQAIHFTRNVNDSFSMFRDNVQRGLLESQNNIRSALEAAIRFGEGKTFKSSTTTTGEYRGVFASTRGRGGRYRGRSRATGRSGFGPCTKYPCKICNATDHWAKDCPDGGKKLPADSDIKKAIDEVRTTSGGDGKKKN